MKCPKCGITNGKTNKFCRECGTRLEEPAEQQVSLFEDSSISAGDVALGEELFSVWQSYEAGELAAALTGVEKIILTHPESSSARSILALIYERKAQKEIESGNILAGQDFLKLALAQYEKIIDLNPDSAADREKLVSLRMKLAGKNISLPGAAAVVTKPINGFKEALKVIPVPYLAAAGAFFLVLMLTIIFWPAPEKPSVKITQAGSSSEPTKLNMPSVPKKSETASSSVNQSRSPSLSVYSFPAQSQPQPQPMTHMSPPALPSKGNSVAKDEADVEPVKLPSLGSELIITPEPSKKPKANQTSVSDGKGRAVVTPADSSPVREASAQIDGSTMLAHAIQLHNQGNNQEAVAAAEQAILLFQSDAQAGKNVDYANRGAENARKLIALWRQPAQ